jgi:hypothetical protein
VKWSLDANGNAVGLVRPDGSVEPVVRTTASFGVVGDGVTDDTVKLQEALDWWVGASNRVLQISPLVYKITAGLTATATSNIAGSKLEGYGAVFVPTAAVANVLTLSVDSALWREITVEGLAFEGANTGYALAFDGKGANITEYLYNFVVREVKVRSGAAGIVGYSNFFEGTIENCHLAAASTSLECIRFENLSGQGVISSITLLQNSTRGGKHGVYLKGDANDVNIIGGTYLSAREEGIKIEAAYGGHITGVHLEYNWTSNPVLTSGQAGINLIVAGAGAFSVINASGRRSGQGQSHIVKAYVAGGACLAVIGGIQVDGSEYVQLSGAAESAAVITGTGTYTADTNVAVSHFTGRRATPAIGSLRQFASVNPVTLTPNGQYGSYFVAMSSNNPTIAAPTFTPVFGDELEFSFEQNGAGGNTVTWNAVYAVGAFVPTAAYGTISTIRLRYVDSLIADKWVTVSTSTT